MRAAMRAPRDAHLPEAERQGILADKRTHWESTLGAELRKQVVFHTWPVRPELDIQPTGRCSLVHRSAEVLAPKTLPPPPTQPPPTQSEEDDEQPSLVRRPHPDMPSTHSVDARGCALFAGPPATCCGYW